MASRTHKIRGSSVPLAGWSRVNDRVDSDILSGIFRSGKIVLPVVLGRFDVRRATANLMLTPNVATAADEAFLSDQSGRQRR